MLVAMVSVHLKNGFFASNNGVEPPFLYAATSLGLTFTGAGALSLDAVLGLSSLVQNVAGGLIVLAATGAAATLVLRRQLQGQASAAD
jgi:hypothetical protein